MQTLMMSCQACVTCVHVHGTCTLGETGMSKYLSDLACTQADLDLAKITASHFQVLNTQNANGNMPNMILIAYISQ